MTNQDLKARYDADLEIVTGILDKQEIPKALDYLLDMEEKYDDPELKAQSLFHIGSIFEQSENIQRACHHYLEVERKYPPPNSWGIVASRRSKAFFKRDPFNLPKPPFPPIVQVEPTNACNLRCIMCPRRKMQRAVGFMDFNVFRKIIDECAEQNVLSIKLFLMGEPTLHKEIVSFVRYIMEHPKGPILCGIQTNGVNLEEKIVEDLMNAGLTSISFSFDAITPEHYEKIRLGANYQQVVDTIKKTVEIKKRLNSNINISIAALTMENSVKSMQQFQNDWSPIVNAISFIPVNQHEGLEIIDSEGELKQAPPEYKPERAKPCLDGMSSLVVRWNGDIGFCCGDWDTSLVLGNTADVSLKSVWEGEQLKKIHDDIRNMRYENIPPCVPCPSKYNQG